MPEAVTEQPTHYELLQLHPAAPLDLVTASYWRLADRLQRARGADGGAAVALHRLTKAYETLTDAQARLRYDESLGIAPQSSIPEALKRPRRRLGWRSKSKPVQSRDYHQVLRVHPSVEPAVLEVAIPIMRDYYLHLVRTGAAPAELLDMVGEAREVLLGSAPGTNEPLPINGEAPRQPSSEGATSGVGVQTPGHAEPPRKPTPAPPNEERSRHRVLSFPGTLVALGASGWRLAAPRIRLVAVASAMWLAHRIRSAWRGSRSLAARTTRVASQALMAASARLAVRDEPEPRISSEDAILHRISSQPETTAGTLLSPDRTLAKLVVTDGPCAGRQFALNGDPVILGSEQCEIDLPGLASRQARLWLRDGQLVICTLVDHPAMHVNGRTVVWATIEKGDQLKIGAHSLGLEFLTASA